MHSHDIKKCTYVSTLAVTHSPCSSQTPWTSFCIPLTLHKCSDLVLTFSQVLQAIHEILINFQEFFLIQIIHSLHQSTSILHTNHFVWIFTGLSGDAKTKVINTIIDRTLKVRFDIPFKSLSWCGLRPTSRCRCVWFHYFVLQFRGSPWQPLWTSVGTVQFGEPHLVEVGLE